jgi:hypothetical protein
MYKDQLATDLYGNVYVENTFDTNPPNAFGTIGGYLFKYDMNGSIVYNANVPFSAGAVIVVDSMQSLYSGYLSAPAPLYNSVVNVIKYNIAGDTAWSRHIAYTADALFTNLGVSNSGTVHIAANVISSPVDQQFTDPTVQGQPGNGNMVYTFDLSGKLTSVKQTNVFTGYYTNTYAFFPSGNYYDVSYAASNGKSDVSVYKYDITSKLTGTDNNIPIAGNTAMFYDNKSNAYNIDSTSVTKLTGAYAKVWSIKTQPFSLIRSDANGNIYIAGKFKGTANFDLSGTGRNLTANDTNDSFLEKFDTNGKLVWVIQSIGVDGKNFTGNSVIDNFVITAKNEIFITGSVQSLSFGGLIHFEAVYTQCN